MPGTDADDPLGRLVVAAANLPSAPLIGAGDEITLAADEESPTVAVLDHPPTGQRLAVTVAGDSTACEWFAAAGSPKRAQPYGRIAPGDRHVFAGPALLTANGGACALTVESEPAPIPVRRNPDADAPVAASRPRGRRGPSKRSLRPR